MDHTEFDMRAGRAPERLYREVARVLTQRITDGTYPVGGRLPPEREISAEFNVSRPTAREAIIALEVQGLVDVRIGSGAYVKPSGGSNVARFDVSAFELTEARLLIESEAAALAAVNISAEELEELPRIVTAIEREGGDPVVAEAADREFHLLIAGATRNAAVLHSVRSLWDLRQTSPECVLLHAKARTAKVKPVVEEHMLIVEALRTRDPARARSTMRAHLGAVIEHLLFSTEEEAIQRVKKAAQDTRARFARAVAM
ncbi:MULTISPECIES: FadR/GntR family transcriptional regulator [unclassified Sphingomonas]|uniref:FadR/GntR family transcriptional regulator n=1 Tax=unclassified Sphingomonas TaxID=196159 RepID=UPI0006F72D00|nr:MULTISPECIES: FadR/GntR family transcriptional regulator [unclassified Sphingomonas]KQX22589.1 GntR family transcriptional regulator [Sphingomonas sp. Root1294]KQY67933.1 GntR family transcriptional regulator [Sphingomonas sp. Root50]KRB88857.1 GntR family transcriptional regulator [Sphingomonas sp. Root720]